MQNVNYFKREYMRLAKKSPDLLLDTPLGYIHDPLVYFEFLCSKGTPKEKSKNFWTVERKGRE